MRKILDGSEVSDHAPVTRSITTKCTDKYVLVDLETGAFYVPNPEGTPTEYQWSNRISHDKLKLVIELAGARCESDKN